MHDEALPKAVAPIEPPTTRRFSESYRKPIYVSVCIGFFWLALWSLALDGGYCVRLAAYALLSQWIGVVLIMFRRPADPTKLDLQFIKYGIVFLWLYGLAAAPFIRMLAAKLGMPSM